QSRKRSVSASGESGGRDENPPAGIGTGARGPTGSGKNALRRGRVWKELRKSKSWSAAASDFSCAVRGGVWKEIGVERTATMSGGGASRASVRAPAAPAGGRAAGAGPTAGGGA